MAMSNAGDPPQLVRPALLRVSSGLGPCAPLAVRKATRSLREYLYRLAALGITSSYEVPKASAKKGSIKTVDVFLSDSEVEILFPKKLSQKARKVAAQTYSTLCRVFLSLLTASLMAAVVGVTQANRGRVKEPVVEEPSFPVGELCLIFFPLVWISAVICYEQSFILLGGMWWLVRQTVVTFLLFTPLFVTVASARLLVMAFICIGVYCYVSLIPTAYKHFSGRLYVWLCEKVPDLEMCPKKTLLQRLLRYFARCVAVCQWVWSTPGVPSALIAFFMVFALTWFCTRDRTMWAVRLKIDTPTFSVVCLQVTRAGQESTSDKVAAVPVITHVANHITSTYGQMELSKRDKYVAVCIFIASAWADNRCVVVDEKDVGGNEVAADEPTPADEGDVPEGGKRILFTRKNTAPHTEWRGSVVARIKSWSQLFDDVQRGQDVVLPGADEVKARVSAVMTGPDICDISEGADGGVEDELGGVSRHLRQLKSLVTGEYLSRELEPDAVARLDRSTAIITDVLVQAATMHTISILGWMLPKKWGSNRDTFYQRVVDWAFLPVWLTLTGFVKLAELALPVNKLPRLIGTLGMMGCAKASAVVGCVEQLMKRFFPHVVLKGFTALLLSERVARFARRARRFGRRLISIDMSAMDSSWLPADRERVLSIIRAVAAAIKEYLDAELQDDHVEQSRSRGWALRWILKYVEIYMDPDESLLFSGERMTSLGNRLLMLIIFGAELLRVYGEEVGEEHFRKVLFCDPNNFHDFDEEGVGVDSSEWVFPDEAWYDCNIGDGDDCAMSVPMDMYSSKEAYVLAYEAYYKLVDVCCEWDEQVDVEVLSCATIVVSANRVVSIPKIQRNFQRCLAHKVALGSLKSGQTHAVLTPCQYREICTDLWQRSFTLGGTMVTRHLVRAMFDYCASKCRAGAVTKYSEDQLRLGHEDGDHSLDDCAQDVVDNCSVDISAFAMVKTSHFMDYDSLSCKEVKELRTAWTVSDSAWAALELNDELCANPQQLLESFPLHPAVAKVLGVKPQLLPKAEKTQLVKDEGVVPDMRVGSPPGLDEGNVNDAANAAGVSALKAQPTCEVKATVAEAVVPEPPKAAAEKDDLTLPRLHAHTCPVCCVAFWHAHKDATASHSHVGKCPDFKCAGCVQVPVEGVTTSSECKAVRQPGTSSSGNGAAPASKGAPPLRSSVRLVGVEPPDDVLRADESQRKEFESKRKLAQTNSGRKASGTWNKGIKDGRPATAGISGQRKSNAADSLKATHGQGGGKVTPGSASSSGPGGSA